MPSPLYVITEKLVDDEWAVLNREKLTPWAFLQSQGVRLTDGSGRVIGLGQGVGFQGSPSDVYWNSRFAESLLEAIIERVLERTVEGSKSRGVPLEVSIPEAAGLLKSISRKTYRRMATIDRGLRGGGSPESVRLRSTAHLEAMMDDYIDRRMAAELPLPRQKEIKGLDGTISKS